MQEKRYRACLFTVRIVAIAAVGLMASLFASVSAQQVDAGKPEQKQGGKVSRSVDATTLQLPQKDGQGNNSEEARQKARKERRRRQRERYPRFSLRNQKQVRELIEDFPDLSRAHSLIVSVNKIVSVPDDLFKKIALHGKNLKALIIECRRQSDGERRHDISDAGMAYISRLVNLKTLCLKCSFSAKGFEQLSKLTQLRTLGLEYPTITAKELFETVSKMPSIRTIGATHADFSQPIDRATHKAIASLSGRLESLSFGRWQETTIHASMIPAIAEIESLTALELGEVSGSLSKGTAHYLLKLPYLERLDPYGSEAMARHRYHTRDTHPVQFRKISSATEMIMLLERLLGRTEARKVRREVIRRRVGISPNTEDFTTPKSKFNYPLLSTIFKKSFDVTLYPPSDVLTFITSQYPELDDQIRRYLSGKDLNPDK